MSLLSYSSNFGGVYNQSRNTSYVIMDLSVRSGEEAGKKGALHWKRVTAGEWLLIDGVWVASAFVYLSNPIAGAQIVAGFGLIFFSIFPIGVLYHSIRYTENTADKLETTSTVEKTTTKGDGSGNQPTEMIRNRARKNTAAAVFLGIFVPPAAYVYVGKWGWAVANLFTVNFLLLGVFIVPIHTYLSIKNAKDEVAESSA